MSLDIATLGSKRASRTFDFDGEKVTITFFPHKITPEYRLQLAALADKAKAGAAESEEAGEDEGYQSALAEARNEQPEAEKQQDARMVAELLDGWDVRANGEAFEPTYEHLLLVPVTLLGRVSSVIMEVIQELSNPTRKKK